MGAFCRTKALGPSMLRVILALALLGCALAWQNSWDRPHNFQCSGGQYINRIRSYHHNHYEDRRWLAYCTRVSGIKADRSCAWTGWVNSWDGILSYTCPAGKVITGMYSQHDNGREDRLFKFKCCSVYSERKNCPNGKFGANCQFSCACKGNAVRQLLLQQQEELLPRQGLQDPVRQDLPEVDLPEATRPHLQRGLRLHRPHIPRELLPCLQLRCPQVQAMVLHH